MTRRTIPLLICLLLAAPAWADDPQSFALTTDTPQYCAQLAKQVSDRHSSIADVERLLSEGSDMCGRGQIRGGIRRLRRALVILHHHRPAKDQTAKAASAKDTPGKPQAAKPPGPTSKPGDGQPSASAPPVAPQP